MKVTSGSTPEIAEIVDQVYKSIIVTGTHMAISIKVAEASKVIENSQRDINIAFVNELSKIFNRIGIDTNDVLAAAGTKWNFLKFKPGSVVVVPAKISQDERPRDSSRWMALSSIMASTAGVLVAIVTLLR